MIFEDIDDTMKFRKTKQNQKRIKIQVFSDSDSNSTCSTSAPISPEDLSWVHRPLSSSSIEPGNRIQPAGDNTWRHVSSLFVVTK